MERQSDANRSSLAAPVPFFTRYGLARTGERDAPLVVTPYAPVLRHGSLRAAVVGAAIDFVGSFFTREIAGADILSTTDLSLRAPYAGAPRDLLVRGRALRAGRTGATTGVELWDREANRLWAYGETTFARIAQPPGSTVTAADLALPAIFEFHPLTRPLEDEVGVTVLDAGRGEVELALRRAVLNSQATLQGALVALLVERAGEVLAEATLGQPQRVCELDLRYLATARQGPIRSRAAFVGEPAQGMLRVELFDAGRDDRITATALLRVAPAR